MNEVYIVAALRTAIGSFNGSLSAIPAHKLGEAVIKQLLLESKIEGKDVSEVILGQVLTAAQGQNPARQTVLNSGMPKEIPALTINQVCGSGLRSLSLGAAAIRAGDSNIVIAGGQENMSMSPHASLLRPGIKMGDGKLIDTMIIDGLWDAFNNYHMGITAENIAKKFNITREEQDVFACASQNKAEVAQKEGKFKNEIVPIVLKSKLGEVSFENDEFIKAGTTLETLARLRPAFDKEGTVTAGNASGINDGAAMLMLVSGEELKKRNLTPLARIVSTASVGVDPAIMGTGPISAVSLALKKAGWNINDLDLIEANEAFASQAICVNKELGWDTSKVNVNGGSIAIGHPIGASGARISVSLIHEMQRRKAKKAVATLCIGGGMGVAICFEGMF